MLATPTPQKNTTAVPVPRNAFIEAIGVLNRAEARLHIESLDSPLILLRSTDDHFYGDMVQVPSSSLRAIQRALGNVEEQLLVRTQFSKSADRECIDCLSRVKKSQKQLRSARTRNFIRRCASAFLGPRQQQTHP